MRKCLPNHAGLLELMRTRGCKGDVVTYNVAVVALGKVRPRVDGTGDGSTSDKNGDVHVRIPMYVRVCKAMFEWKCLCAVKKRTPTGRNWTSAARSHEAGKCALRKYERPTAMARHTLDM